MESDVKSHVTVAHDYDGKIRGEDICFAKQTPRVFGRSELIKKTIGGDFASGPSDMHMYGIVVYTWSGS